MLQAKFVSYTVFNVFIIIVNDYICTFKKCIINYVNVCLNNISEGFVNFSIFFLKIRKLNLKTK